MKKEINRILLPILILIISNIILVLLYTRFSYNFGADGGFPLPLYKEIWNSLFIFQKSNYSGLINPYAGSSIELIYNLLFLGFELLGLTGLKYFAIVNFVFVTIIGSTGMFLLIYNLIEDYGKINYKFAIVVSYFCGLIFTSSFGYFNSVIYPAYLIPFSLLFFYILIKNVYSVGRTIFLFSLTVIALAFELSIAGTANIPQVLILTFSLFFIAAIIINNKVKLKSLLYLSGIFALSLLIVLPILLFGAISEQSLSAEVSSLATTHNFQTNLIIILKSLVPFSFDLYPNFLMVVGLLIFILSLLFCLLLLIKSKYSFNKAFTIAIVSTIILFLTLNLTINKPFGTVFSYIYIFLPQLLVFSSIINSLPELFLLFILLFGIGFYYALIKTKRLYTKLLVFIVFMIFISILLYFNAILPIVNNKMLWSYHLFPFIGSLPNHTVEIANFINHNVTNFSVATLPSDEDWHLDTWYDAPDIYSSLIDAPVYTGGFTSYSEFFFPSSQDQYGSIAKIYEEDKTNYSVSDSLGVFGIKYIIVQGDTANKSFGPNHPLIPYNFSIIYKNLNNSNSITVVKRFSNSTIYLNKKAAPLVYSSNIIRINNDSSIGIIYFIAKNHINPFNYSIYSSNVSGPILWYGNVAIFNSSNTINATPISNFAKPDISFVQDTPTKVTVHVSNATTPYYLVFRETYDQHWAAFYSNGTEVNPRDHIAVNGFANAWYMNKTGNYTITLYYTLQTEAWLAWGVSFAALFVTIGIGVYGWRRMRKEKRKSAIGRSLKPKRQ